MKMIKAKGYRRFNGHMIEENQVFFQNGDKLVNIDFQPVDGYGEVIEITEIETGYVTRFIDNYACFIDNWTQQKAAEAKNDRIRKFLGM